jgi:hypothetical protein
MTIAQTHDPAVEFQRVLPTAPGFNPGEGYTASLVGTLWVRAQHGEPRMAWKLRTFDQTVSRFWNPGQTMTRSDDALNAACDLLDHVKILRVEGPDGEQIELPEIEKWCASTGRKAP